MTKKVISFLKFVYIKNEETVIRVIYRLNNIRVLYVCVLCVFFFNVIHVIY